MAFEPLNDLERALIAATGGDDQARAAFEQALLENDLWAASRSAPDDSETLIVRGTLKTGASANARQTLAAFNMLVDALKANPKLQVAVLQSPFDIESGRSLKGSDTAVDDNRPRAFSLQIVRKLGS